MTTTNSRICDGHNGALTFAAAALLTGCGGDDGSPATMAEDSDDATPAAVGELGPGAFDPDYQTSAEFFTRMSAPMESGVHAQQRTWYSVNVADLPEDGPFSVPEGTTAIKAEYDDEGEFFLSVVMIKREAGYDPNGNDWYYEARNPDGSLASSPAPGRVTLCSGCHSRGASTDFLLAFDLEN